MTRFADEYCYLTMTSGARTGTSFLLDAGQPNRLGRGTDCEIVLIDPNCSREHARIERAPDGWCVVDQQSRNGVFVNDHKVDRTNLRDGDRLRMGATEFTFYQTDEPPTLTAAREQIEVPTVVKQTPVDPVDSAQLLFALENAEFAHDLLVIYQLSVKLLGFDEPDPVIETSIDLLFERTKSSVVGFLWANDSGQLRPKFVLPDKAEDVLLNESLSTVVFQQGKAVWISNHGADPRAALRRYSDAICVPLVKNRMTIGALHLYLKQGRYRQADFDFAISVANLMAVSLIRTRKEAARKADYQRLADDVADVSELIGESLLMREVKSKIARIGPARGSVLIRGESGSGKELVARALHATSTRSDRAMLSVNCAAIPADLIDSQLFGYVKGAFTGAERDHEGWFHQADNGTLLLDEIGDLPLSGQAKLLRILEGHPFLPVGATQEVSVDVRVIAATNRDLKELTQQKRFRHDLYYRLTVFDLELPPLRERGDDLELLLNHFLDHFRKRHGRPQLKLSSAAREHLLAYDWPGNVRQLRNVMDSAVILAEGNAIEREDLGLRPIPTGNRPTNLRIAEWERMLIVDALEKTRGKIPEAARLLGIGRATLYRKIDQYRIPRRS